jgi:hypothetical protein
METENLEHFFEDMQRYEELFPDVKIIVEMKEYDDGDFFYAEIAGNMFMAKTYGEVKDFLDSFIGQDLPKDPQVAIDRENSIRESI